MGHNGDDYGYDKSSYRDEQWCKKVETELSKMTDVLNLKTGHASAYYATKEEELKAKILKDFIRMGIESGSMKPEICKAPVLKLYLSKLGVKEKTWVSQQLDPRRFKVHWFTPEEHKELDSLAVEERDKKVQEINRKLYTENDAQRRVELFEALAKAVELDEAVHQKCREALKVLRDDTTKKASWENHTDGYIRVEVGSDDYMQAHADDFKTIDSDGKMRIMSKPKPNDVVLSTNEASTNEQTVERKAADCGK